MLSYESHAIDDHYVFYVSVTNKGGDGDVEIICEATCGPMDPFPEEKSETTSDGTSIVYSNSNISSLVVEVGTKEPGAREYPTTSHWTWSGIGWITLTKVDSLHMRSGEITVVQVFLCSLPYPEFHTEVFARAKSAS